MCEDNLDKIMERIRVLAKRDKPLLAVDIGSDGLERWSCPVCGEWWYGEPNFCMECGQRMKYQEE